MVRTPPWRARKKVCGVEENTKLCVKFSAEFEYDVSFHMVYLLKSATEHTLGIFAYFMHELEETR